MIAFDTELADLERDMKAKKQDIADSELNLKKLDHDIGLVAKERTTAEGQKDGLEKQFTWIVDEHQSVNLPGRKSQVMTIQLLRKARDTI